MSDSVTVLIVDDEALIRAGLRTLLDSAPDLAVVGEAASGAQAIKQARALHPDLILMDIRMPVMDGLEATTMLTAENSDSRILIVTTFGDDEYVFAALRAGASGFVLKDTPPERLLDAVRIVAAGDALLSPEITGRLIAEFTRRPAGPPPSAALEDLTPREREVLEHVAAGRSNTDIAEVMFVSVATVKTHVSRLLTKLDVRDRTQLVVLAYETGVVTPTGRQD
jgi:DNA-binding NarL/FixJ family response regulator